MISIDNYVQYLNHIKMWAMHTTEDQLFLKQWYRDYYESNKEQERNRFREYYLLNKEFEKIRTKKQKIQDML